MSDLLGTAAPITPAPVLNPFGTAAELSRVAAICYPVETTYWCTSTLWSRLVNELRSLPPSAWADPSKMPTPQNFKRMKIQTTTFINSGTADKRVCDLRNDAEARKAQFADKHARLATQKKDAIEYVDPASTIERPEDVLKDLNARVKSEKARDALSNGKLLKLGVANAAVQ